MHNQTNTALYELFERIIREMLDTATLVNIDHEVTALSGQTRIVGRSLTNREFDLIPWGKVDAIREAYWYPGGEPGRFVARIQLMLPEFMNVRVFVMDNGIGVDVAIRDYVQIVLVSITGSVRKSGPREVIGCDNEDDVVAEVRKIIEGIFEDYEAETAPRPDDYLYDDDRSRYDPLDELNYPLNER